MVGVRKEETEETGQREEVITLVSRKFECGVSRMF
jgi:hypothetical protein